MELLKQILQSNERVKQKCIIKLIIAGKKKGHGFVSLRNAMKQSCDTYFYEIARKLGVDKLSETAKKFGLGKEVFGGTGMNILNPALTARAFAFFAYPTYMSGNKVWVSEASNVDAISGETILGTLAAGGEVSYSMFEMFQGAIPGSIAETSTLWVAVGALILILTGVGSWRIIFGGVLGAAVMGLLFNVGGANALMSFSWMNHLVVGGFAFGIVFMATDPVSGAQTNKGKWIYGILVGIFCIMIRVFNPAYPEGVMLAILLMNVFAPTIDHYVVNGNIKKRKKRWAIAQELKTA